MIDAGASGGEAADRELPDGHAADRQSTDRDGADGNRADSKRANGKSAERGCPDGTELNHTAPVTAVTSLVWA